LQTILPKDSKEVLLVYSQLTKFQRKVKNTLDFIQLSLTVTPIVYVAVSWGKDSIVMLNLCQQIKPDIKVISFGHTDRELLDNYAEVEQNYCQRFKTNLETIYLEGDHVPDKVKKTKLKEQYQLGFIGLRKEESKSRAITLTQPLRQYQDGTWRACPLGNWTAWDIWAYIIKYDLPYLNSYNITGIEGRTSDHISKSLDKTYQLKRLEYFKRFNNNYYQKLCREIAESEL